MTFWYDEDADELVGNNLAQYVTVEDDGTVRIDVEAIYEEGRAEGKMDSIRHSVVNAIDNHKEDG